MTNDNPRARWRRRGRIAAISVIAVLAISGLYEVVYYIDARQPTHQVSVDCYALHVYFEGQKSAEYLTAMAANLKYRKQPYIIKNDRIFSTIDGAYDEEEIYRFIIHEIHPNWFSDHPTFENARVRALVETWKNRENLSTDDGEKAWCRVIEAAISKNGIDAQARRDHPDIWPPDKFPVPAE